VKVDTSKKIHRSDYPKSFQADISQKKHAQENPNGTYTGDPYAEFQKFLNPNFSHQGPGYGYTPSFNAGPRK
jgi:hypothetical protein